MSHDGFTVLRDPLNTRHISHVAPFFPFEFIKQHGRLSRVYNGQAQEVQPQTGSPQKEPLQTTFSCLFCNHENCVIVKLDKKLGLGNLSCKICGQRFQTGINYLSAAVDVYSDWVDACDAVAKDAAAGNDIGTTIRGANEGSPGPVGRGTEREELDQAEADLDDY
ncbi:transcription elongation factor Elf1 [Histoplasma capsulatum]|uniref:Transcription elongation factor 1 homolog n=1 Tax=Ajellomyces capsulatus TaxID=5037 RepID=A0A8A1MMX0_AJECA|nr:transcription elongation factor Elf1 [Histoplasma capsulatum]